MGLHYTRGRPHAASRNEESRSIVLALAIRRWMNHAHRLQAMALGVAKGAAHAAVEGFDGGVKDATCGIEMARAKSVGIARQAGARVGEGLGADGAFQGAGNV